MRAIETPGAPRAIERYEVSAYARPGRGCRHNLNYWRFGDYLGIGAGAHGKLTLSAPTVRVTRSVKQRHPRSYLDAGPARRGRLRGGPVPARTCPSSSCSTRCSPGV